MASALSLSVPYARLYQYWAVGNAENIKRKTTPPGLNLNEKKKMGVEVK